MVSRSAAAQARTTTGGRGTSSSLRGLYRYLWSWNVLHPNGSGSAGRPWTGHWSGSWANSVQSMMGKVLAGPIQRAEVKVVKSVYILVYLFVLQNPCLCTLCCFPWFPSTARRLCDGKANRPIKVYDPFVLSFNFLHL